MDNDRNRNRFGKIMDRVKWKLLSFGENYVEKIARLGFKKLGFTIARHPYLFLVIPLLTVCLLSTGMLKMKPALDVYVLYMPSNARALPERRTAEEYFDDEGGMYLLKMIITAKDGGSLLRPSYIRDVLDLIDYVEFNYTAHYGGYSYTFNDIRVNHKNENELVKKFLLLYNSSIDSKMFHFGYPLLDLKSQQISIATCVSDVTVNETDGQLESVKQIIARFKSAKVNESYVELFYNWESKFLTPDGILMHPRLNFYASSDRLVSHEIQQNGKLIKNFTPISFGVIVIFAIITSSTRNCVTSKPWEAICGIMVTLMSVGGSLGIMFYANYPFLAMLLVIPVLVLALGLDVTFILLRNWKMTNANLSVEERIAETMAESGPSIIITSLTNVISAGVGAITTTMAVNVFCLTTSIAVMLLFILQITVLPAVIVLGARREKANLHALFLCVKVKTPESETENNNEPAHPDKASPKLSDHTDIHAETHDWWYFVSEKLAKFECTYCWRIVITLLLLVYWGVAIWGCTKLTLGLSLENVFLKSSIMNKFYKLDNGGLHQSITVYVFVSNAPNFSNLTEATRFGNMVNDFENSAQTFGKNATMLWSRPYKDFYSWNHPEDENFTNFYQDLDEFLTAPYGKHWKNFLTVVKSNETTNVPKFFFSLCYKTAESWNQRTQFTDIWRDIVDNYTDFNASIWDDENENFYTDQLINIPSNTVQDVTLTAVCMAIICVLFIPNIFNAMCAMITIISINVGVFGFMVHWGVSLDFLSMACLLMAIGFSVDFTSHISFHYYTSEGSSQCEKLTSALASIGYPMLQSGTATVLSIACICFVPSYMVWLFFKTIFLVVLIGLLHGLLILPTYLAWLPLNFWANLCVHKSSTKSAGPFKNRLHGSKPDIVRDINVTHF